MFHIYSAPELNLCTECTDTWERKCHNCSCGTTFAENFGRYRNRIWIISNVVPRNSSWQSKSLHSSRNARLFPDSRPIQLFQSTPYFEALAVLIILHLAPFDGDTYIENEPSQEVCYIYFLTTHYNNESLCANFVSLDTQLKPGQGWHYESEPTCLCTSCSRVSGWKEGIKHAITYIKHLIVVNKRPRGFWSVGCWRKEKIWESW